MKFTKKQIRQILSEAPALKASRPPKIRGNTAPRNQATGACPETHPFPVSASKCTKTKQLQALAQTTAPTHYPKTAEGCPVGHTKDATGKCVPKKSEGGPIVYVPDGTSCPDGYNAIGRDQSKGIKCSNKTSTGQPAQTPPVKPKRRPSRLGVAVQKELMHFVRATSTKLQEVELPGGQFMGVEDERSLRKKTIGSTTYDGVIGKTTWGSLKRIPALAGLVKTKWAARRNAKKIYQTLKACRGHEEKCLGRSTSTPKPPPGHKPEKKSAKQYEPHEGRPGGKAWGGAKCRYAEADSTNFHHICKQGEMCLQNTDKPVSFTAPSGKCQNASELNESKSPLKQKEIKHFGVRRNKLLETLIKKVSK